VKNEAEKPFEVDDSDSTSQSGQSSQGEEEEKKTPAVEALAETLQPADTTQEVNTTTGEMLEATVRSTKKALVLKSKKGGSRKQ